MQETRERLSANLKAMNSNTMLKAWLATTFKGFDQLQELFASQMNLARKR